MQNACLVLLLRVQHPAEDVLSQNHPIHVTLLIVNLNIHVGRVWWHKPLNSTFRDVKQGYHHEFHASLGYMVIFFLKHSFKPVKCLHSSSHLGSQV